MLNYQTNSEFPSAKGVYWNPFGFLSVLFFFLVSWSIAELIEARLLPYSSSLVRAGGSAGGSRSNLKGGIEKKSTVRLHGTVIFTGIMYFLIRGRQRTAIAG